MTILAIVALWAASSPQNEVRIGIALQAPTQVLPSGGAPVRAQPPRVPLPPLYPARPRRIGAMDLGLPSSSGFGFSLAAIGDLDDDGVQDLAVGAPGVGKGSVEILFLNSDRSVRAHVSNPNPASFAEEYATNLCALGDVDADGVEDLAASDPYYSNVYVHFMRTDGTIRASVDIAPSSPVGQATWGQGLAGLGDVDSDGVPDLLVNTGRGLFGGTNYCSTFFLRADGTAKGYTYTAPLGHAYSNCATLGDLDGDGIREVALMGTQFNSVWVCFLRPDGSLRDAEGFTAVQEVDSIANVGDLDGDGVPDWAVGDSDGNDDRGRYWLSRLDAAGQWVPGSLVPVDGPQGWAPLLEPSAGFGFSMAFLGNLDGIGDPEIAVGARECVWVCGLLPRWL